MRRIIAVLMTTDNDVPYKYVAMKPTPLTTLKTLKTLKK